MNRAGTSKINPQPVMEQVHLVIFRLGQQTFALPIESIYQIIEMVDIRPVPRLNPIVEGIINVHGRVVPIIDMHRLLNNTATQRRLHTPIILTYIKGQMTGLIVHEVLNVSSVYPNQIARPADFLPIDLESIPILRGLTKSAQETIILLELDYLLEYGQGRDLGEVSQTLDAVRRMSAAPGIDLPPLAESTFTESLPSLQELPEAEPTLSSEPIPFSPELPEAEPALPSEPIPSLQELPEAEPALPSELLPEESPFPALKAAPAAEEDGESGQGFERVTRALEEMHREATPEPPPPAVEFTLLEPVNLAPPPISEAADEPPPPVKPQKSTRSRKSKRPSGE